MKDLGLDKSLPVQYANWIVGLMHGDLGFSYVTDRPAIKEILPRIPITARIAGLAVIFAALIGIPLGVISAVKQNTRLDYILRVIVSVGTVDAELLAGIVGPDGLRRLVRHDPDLHRCAAELLAGAGDVQCTGRGRRDPQFRP